MKPVRSARSAIVSAMKRSSAGRATLRALRNRQRRIIDAVRKDARNRRRWDDIATPVTFVTKMEKFVVRADDSVIGRRIYLNGHFDFHKFNAALEVLGREQVNTLYDVGANLGSICIPAVARGLAKRAVAFEPDPTNFALLDMNSRWNGIGQLIARYNCALGESSAIVGLRYPDSNNFGDIQTDVSSIGSITAHMRTLDDCGFDFDAHRDLLWMDVQGHELKVLSGASRARAAGVPIVLEFSPSRWAATGSCDELLGLLHRYRFFIDLSARDVGRRPLAELRDLWTSCLLDAGRETDIVVMTDGETGPVG
jgi:FkbM family methyltransferase